MPRPSANHPVAPLPPLLVVLALLLSATCPADEDASADADYVPPQRSDRENRELLESLQAEGAVIRSITFKRQKVFDLSNPKEDKWLYRLANQLHIVTKERVLKSQLLFEEGDPLDVRLLEESERLLRLNSYLREADLRPVAHEDGTVDLELETIDVWTLTPEISLARGGGENRFGIGVLEQNLFGQGIQLGAIYKSTVDRDRLSFQYEDNNFLLDRYRLAADYSNNSDGFYRRFEFARPFYALDTRRAGQLFYSEGQQIDQLYDRGEVVAEYDKQFAFNRLSAGFSRGLRNGWVSRYTAGVAYSKNEFMPTADTTLPVSLLPEDREFIYPFLGYELLQDYFETTTNFDQIHRTEDRFLGTWLSFGIGYASESIGSSVNAWLYRAGYAKAFLTTSKTSLTLRTDVDGRWQDGEARNASLSGELRFHRRLTENQLFYASLSGVAGYNLDFDNPLYLGGQTGLRGYPLRYQNGESKALLTLEHRLYTEWFPFQLMHVGGALFFDAGRVWGDSPVGARNLGILKDVGFGLRLGNTRSGNGKVLHIDIAFPLDGEDDIDSVQILVDAKASF